MVSRHIKISRLADHYAPIHLTALVSIDATMIDTDCLEIPSDTPRQELVGAMWERLADPDPSINYVVSQPFQAALSYSILLLLIGRVRIPRGRGVACCM